MHASRQRDVSSIIQMMQYFLAKTEPRTYSIDDLERDGQTVWDGVHNHQAIAAIKAMQPGDRVFIYHSVSGKNIVGEAEVTAAPFENTADPRYSWAVTLSFVRRLNGPTLAECKATPLCRSFQLVTHSRLSTMPVPDDIAHWILACADER